MLKKIPNAEKIKAKIKESFIKRYKELCPDYDKFIEYSLSFLRKSIRINTLKISVKEFVQAFKDSGWILEKIPFCDTGFYVKHHEERLDIGNTIEHQLGYYYVQEAASMLPPIVLNPKQDDTVLDMCASPGSKTTQMAAMMNNKGIIIANDVSIDRMKPLTINLQRCGVMNTIITMEKGQRFKDKGLSFSKILVDAPCSATGAIRKSIKTLEMWNPYVIKGLSKLQKRLIEAAFNVLQQDGIVVYSTCSLEPEENEEVVDFLINKYNNAKIERIKIDNLKTSPCILEFEGKKYNEEIKKCLRIWPYDNDTEGFFIAKIRKT